MDKNQHVVPSDKQRAVNSDGNFKNKLITRTQKVAIEIACTVAQKEQSEFIFHGKNNSKSIKK